MSKVGGAVSSSSMISLQRSMHSSQMYPPGPAISFLTCRCDFPQKEQRSCSFESVGRAIQLVLSNHPVDDAVLLRFFGRHEVVAFGIGPNLLHVLARVLGDDLIQAAAKFDDFARVDLDVRRLTLKA